VTSADVSRERLAEVFHEWLEDFYGGCANHGLENVMPDCISAADEGIEAAT
jgi:hypothetical protein